MYFVPTVKTGTKAGRMGHASSRERPPAGQDRLGVGYRDDGGLRVDRIAVACMMAEDADLQAAVFATSTKNYSRCVDLRSAARCRVIDLAF